MAELRINADPAPEPKLEAPAGAVEDGKGGVSIATEAQEQENLIGGKFKSQEDLLAAYQALEKKQGTTAKETPKVEAPAPTPAEAQAQVEAAGLDFDALSKEYTEKGEISEDSLKALEAKGISRATVDAYVRGQAALAEQFTQTLAGSVGGQEALKGILEWAATNLTPAEIQAYNDVIDSGDVAKSQLALSGIASRYTAVNGQEPSLVNGDGPGRSGVQPFDNWAQVTEAMRDPKYKTDSAYRAKVEKRVALSDL